jgi:UDP-N-acetyl-D-galactosamine dehydrogenase
MRQTCGDFLLKLNTSSSKKEAKMVGFDELKSRQEKLAVVGLGYVGLPLALSLSRHFSIVGFDIKPDRVSELNEGHDRTREVDEAELKKSGIFFCSDASELQKAKFIIVAVPTPVKDISVPDMSLLEKASAMVGKNLSKGAVVVFESTVYPGATQEVCLPILEQVSGLKAGADFKLGY